MPTYEYVCKQCGKHLEVVQSFYDDPLKLCEECGGELRKVFGNIGIVFKGSGFYKTDSRGSSSAVTATSPKGAETPSPASTPAGGDAASTSQSSAGSSSSDSSSSTASSATKGSDSAA